MKTNNQSCLYGFAILFLLLQSGLGEEKIGPKVVPIDRAQILEALEALKARSPRLPLPPEAREASPTQAATPSGSLGVVNNGLMRNFYLPAELRSGGFSRQLDPAMKLDNVFSTELFWIVSRVNNCHYCLGHQEAKLKAAGVEEMQLFELDTNWKKFPADRQAAFSFARKLTYAPHTIVTSDIEELRIHFAAPQILEIAFLVGRYNSTNRWTDSLGIPQENHRQFQSELSPEALKTKSQVAVEGFPPRIFHSDWQGWHAEFETASRRASRLPLEESNDPNYERLLATFPVAGRQWIEQIRQAQAAGTLPMDLKERIAYVAARADSAWYMQHRSRAALLKRGLGESEIFQIAFDATNTTENSSTDNPATPLALRFAYKLTATPQSMADADITGLLKHFSPQQVAEIIFHVGMAAFLDRVTETAGLGWSDELP